MEHKLRKRKASSMPLPNNSETNSRACKFYHTVLARGTGTKRRVIENLFRIDHSMAIIEQAESVGIISFMQQDPCLLKPNDISKLKLTKIGSNLDREKNLRVSIGVQPEKISAIVHCPNNEQNSKTADQTPENLFCSFTLSPTGQNCNQVLSTQANLQNCTSDSHNFIIKQQSPYTGDLTVSPTGNSSDHYGIDTTPSNYCAYQPYGNNQSTMLHLTAYFSHNKKSDDWENKFFVEGESFKNSPNAKDTAKNSITNGHRKEDFTCNYDLKVDREIKLKEGSNEYKKYVTDISDDENLDKNKDCHNVCPYNPNTSELHKRNTSMVNIINRENFPASFESFIFVIPYIRNRPVYS